MNCDEPYQNPAAEYVRLAILVLQKATSTADLIDWWFAEKDNRVKWKLSPHQWPGLDLKQAFEAKRTELRKRKINYENL